MQKEMKKDYNRRAVPRHITRRIMAKLDTPIYIYNMGCLHYGAEQFSHTALEVFKTLHGKHFLTDPNRYAILTGDMFDDFRRTLQKEVDKADKTIREIIEESAIRKMDNFLQEFSFLKGQVIASVEGNHGLYLPSLEKTADEYVANKLGTSKDLHGGIATIFLEIQIGKVIRDYKILAFHGKAGGGHLIGTKLHEMQRKLESFDPDAIMTAHAHTSVSAKTAQIKIQKDGIEAKPVILCRTGSWFKGYQVGQESYAAEALYNPSALDMSYITITPIKFRNEIRLVVEYHG